MAARDDLGAGELIRAAVTARTGVEEVRHRFGGIEYRFGRKAMGQVRALFISHIDKARARVAANRAGSRCYDPARHG